VKWHQIAILMLILLAFRLDIESVDAISYNSGGLVTTPIPECRPLIDKLSVTANTRPSTRLSNPETFTSHLLDSKLTHMNQSYIRHV